MSPLTSSRSLRATSARAGHFIELRKEGDRKRRKEEEREEEDNSFLYHYYYIIYFSSTHSTCWINLLMELPPS